MNLAYAAVVRERERTRADRIEDTMLGFSGGKKAVAFVKQLRGK